MGPDHRHSLKDYWSREEQYCTPFYSKVMARDHVFHILQFLHLKTMTTLRTMTTQTMTDFGKYKRKIFDILNNKLCELYNPKEQLAVDEVVMLYKGRVVFQQYIPKNIKDLASKFTNFAALWATLMI